jgi:hypothetical protein
VWNVQFTWRSKTIFFFCFVTKSLLNRTSERQEHIWEGSIIMELRTVLTAAMYWIGVTQELVCG